VLHTVCYGDSTATAQTDTDIPLLSDSSVTVLNGHPIFPVPIYLMWAYMLGATVIRARVSTPKLKPILRPVITPVDANATPTENLRICEFHRHPLLLNAVEEVQILRTNNPGGAERNYVVLTVGDNNRNVPQGDMYIGRATSTLTPVANTWTTGTLSMDDTLQVGRYSIIGMRTIVANGVAGRLIFPGAPIQGSLPQIRPGVVNVTANAAWVYPPFRFGNLGEYGQFESFAVPALEFMSTSTTANPDVIMDIVNVRLGARAA
jgi:hypothetical protein